MLTDEKHLLHSIHPQPTSNDSTINFTPLAALRLRWLPPAIVGSRTRPPPPLAQREVTQHHVLVYRLSFPAPGLGTTQPWAKSRAHNRRVPTTVLVRKHACDLAANIIIGKVSYELTPLKSSCADISTWTDIEQTLDPYPTSRLDSLL